MLFVARIFFVFLLSLIVDIIIGIFLFVLFTLFKFVIGMSSATAYSICINESLVRSVYAATGASELIVTFANIGKAAAIIIVKVVTEECG